MKSERIGVALQIVALLAILVGAVGCESRPTIGGDSPVTARRLAGARLTDIGDTVAWTFDETSVAIENQGEPLPADLVLELLGDGSQVLRIDAAWRLDEAAGLLRLSNVKADGRQVVDEAGLAVRPAGQIRVDIGRRQYNLRPGG